MGFSTNITIQNDFWHEIYRDPQKLADAILVGMNEGQGDPLAEVSAAKYGRRFRHDQEELRWARLNYVSVHRAQHNDTSQVIVNTYGSHAIAAHELPYAIQQGWLDLNRYNKEHAEEVAKELTRLARNIRQAIKEQA